jgi:hypothetical protein
MMEEQEVLCGSSSDTASSGAFEENAKAHGRT